MPRLSRLLPSVLALLLLIVPVVAYLAVDDGRLARMGFTPHAPDWRLLLTSPPAIQVHVAAALTALAIGIVLLMGVKGSRLHRTLGWIWVLAMATTAVSSFFIHRLNPGGPGGFSLIHLLTGWTGCRTVGRGRAIWRRRATIWSGSPPPASAPWSGCRRAGLNRRRSPTSAGRAGR